MLSLLRTAQKGRSLPENPKITIPAFDVNPNTADSITGPLDADSIEQCPYRGGLYYHPVFLGHRIHVFLETYRRTGDQKYLRRAEKYVRKIMEICDVVDGTAYARYPFKYSVHVDSSITFEPPWYSGMAQGEFLGLLVALNHFTGNNDYIQYAHMVFKSFLRIGMDKKPWVVRIDSSGFYWIEEYPHQIRPGQTLNGFIGAVFGIYDYYQATGDPAARRVYDASITTLKEYLPQYRRPGKYSYYCLGHLKEATPAYHQLHIQMLRRLYQLSGDPFFQVMADIFKADIPSDATR